MQNDETKKTKSAPNSKLAPKPLRTLIIAASILIILVGFFVAYYLLLAPFRSRDRIDLSNFSVETVSTSAERAKGLSGHEPLQNNQAMLFDFSDGADGRCFWMKDMTFNIDIIWLDSDNYVYKIIRNTSPTTYPKSFCANQNPAYVLETAAGRSIELGIDTGKQLKF